jgi:glycosyltransferase involved in cell wall biosynthesis
MENTRSLKDRLTIIIPSKNEGKTLYDCIYHISKQKGILGTRIIIADVSDEKESLQWIDKIKVNFKTTPLTIHIIKGGYPSQGRLAGSLLVKTPYMLFLDADVFLKNPNTLVECTRYKKDLVTVPFHTDYPYRWVFRMFDVFQKLSTLLGTPFAVGGFQLWKTQTYWILGGYNPEELFAEDYSISQKVNPKEFRVHKIKGTYTSSRRFKNKGVLWMFKIMIKSYINRKNPEFFKHHHNYWN